MTRFFQLLIDSRPLLSPAFAKSFPALAASSRALTDTTGVGYMISASPAWTGKTAGYTHILGFGSGLLVGYRIDPRTGHWHWSTLVDHEERPDGPGSRQYHSDGTQIPLLLSLLLYLRSVYIMSLRALCRRTINAGFDAAHDKFTGIQLTYDGTLGYTTDRSRRVWTDVGVFYQAHQKGAWD